jgi:hypothetical protein
MHRGNYQDMKPGKRKYHQIPEGLDATIVPLHFLKILELCGILNSNLRDTVFALFHTSSQRPDGPIS